MSLATIRAKAQKTERDYLAYERRINRQAWMHEHDEQLMGGIRPRTHPLVAERRGIERMYKNWIECRSKDTGVPPEIVDSLIAYCTETIQHHYDKIESSQETPPSTWYKEARKDVMTNFLHDEFLDQLESQHPIRTFSAYATFVSVKAVINLFSEHKGGSEVFQSIHPDYLPVPDREAVIAFKNKEEFDETDPVWYLTHALRIPGVWEAAQTIQIHYSNLARYFREEDDLSELPDYLFSEGSEVSEEILMEIAVQSYLAEEGAADDIASLYGIGQKRFRKELRNRGIMISHGGDRKKGR